MMVLRDALLLGRVSNLPTVWTNVAAGALLAGATVHGATFVVLLVAMTLAYVGGMYLNDACDAQIDARERPSRPIPSGRVSVSTVLTAGYAMLVASIVLAALAAVPGGAPAMLWAALAAMALSITIIVYDRNHKGNPIGPVIMGLCRFWVYIVVALALAALSGSVLIAAFLMLCHIVGLTYLAKQETLGRVANLWPLAFLGAPLIYGLTNAGQQPIVLLPLSLLTIVSALAVTLAIRRQSGDIGNAVRLLIAAICLLDAVFIASTGSMGAMWLAMAAFPLTLLLQRYVPGT